MTEPHGNKGKIPWNKGKTGVYTEKTIEKMKNARIDKVPWNKGIPHDEKTLEKISESLKGKVPWNKGIPHSKETKVKISNKNSGKKRSKCVIKNMKKRMNGSGNNNWKGGYSINDIASYNTFAKQLTIEESPLRDKKDQNILTVLCSKCKKRFIPRLRDVAQRVRTLKGTANGESRLYCSQECKTSCSVFNKSLYQDDHPKRDIVLYTDDEYKTFREFVLKRDKYSCQFCEEQATDVHHERPRKLEPLFVLDPDYAWSCCEKCHYEKGHKDECSTGRLAKVIC
jgi:5-methylcytosine-specific restriction endonuclease McrA